MQHTYRILTCIVRHLLTFVYARLHSLRRVAGAMNPYQSTIAAVGGILDNYDSDKMYPVYGFGAKVGR